MPFKNLKHLLPFLLLPLLAGCDPQEEVATTHVVGPPRPGSWLSVHKTPPSAPTGAAAIGSPGKAKALFVDVARQAGLDYRWTIPGPRPLDILQTIGNGCAFLDYNNSSNLSVLLVGTSHLALFQGDGHGHFRDVSHATGLDKLRGHFLGCAVGNFDNDGRVDALVVDSEGAPLLLRNESKPVGHWLSFKLIGTKSNRDGIGARVTVTAGGLTQTRLCHTDGSYLSASDLRVHVGLGEAAVAQTVTVRWPSGQVDVLHTVKADRFLTVREGGK